MTMRRRFRRGGARSPRAKTSWENLAFNATHTAAASVTLADLTPGIEDNLVRGTLMRALIHFDLNQIDTNVNNVQFVSVGIAVITADAFVAGATPDPEGDFDQDWYYWRAWGIDIDATVGFNFPFDIKTSRKLRAGFGLMLVFETGVVSAGSLQVELQARGLWQTP